MAYSYSALNEHTNCPLKYKFKRVDKLKEPTSLALQTGAVSHDYFSEYTKFCAEHRYETHIDFMDQVRPANNQIVDDVTDIMQTFIDSHTFDWGLISNLHSEQAIAFDRNWNVVAWDSTEAWFRMKIDEHHLERDLLVVRDFKTDRAIQFTQKTFSEKPLLQIPQLAIYAYGVSILPDYKDLQRFLVLFDYVRYGLGGVRKRVVDREELGAVPTFIEEEIAKIEADTEFAPRISSFCDYCGFTMKCSAMQKALEDSGDFILQTEAEAQALAEKVRALAVSVGNYKAKLRSWVDSNKPLIVGNESLDFHPKSSKIYRGRGLIGRLLETVDAEKLYGALNFSETDIKGLWRELGLKEFGIKQKDFVLGMEEFKEEVTGTEFGFKKIKE